MVYNISKGAGDLDVDQLVDKATKVLETVADKSWVPWASHLIPNMAH